MTTQTRPNHTGIVMLHDGSGGRKRLTITPHASAAYTIYSPADRTYIQNLTVTHAIADAVAMTANERPDVLELDGSREVFAKTSVADAFTFTLENA